MIAHRLERRHETAPYSVFPEVQARLQDARIGLVLDVDEALVLSVQRWTEEMNALFLRLGYLDTPWQYDEVCRAGGTQGSFGKDPRIPPEHFKRASQRRLRSARFNRGLPMVEENIPQVLAALDAQSVPVGMYLTARPEVVTEVTKDELYSLGFPTAPVLARPDDVPDNQVSAWKYQQLRQVATLTNAPLVMVDDSVSMADYIHQHHNRPDADFVDKRIFPLVYKGARTGETNGHTVVTWQTITDALASLLQPPLSTR